MTQQKLPRWNEALIRDDVGLDVAEGRIGLVGDAVVEGRIDPSTDLHGLPEDDGLICGARGRP
jgi:hypothetical protein